MHMPVHAYAYAYDAIDGVSDLIWDHLCHSDSQYGVWPDV